jgi:sulfur transfer protein SufE
LQHLSDVVQNGLRTLRHRKDMPAKMEHPFVRVSGCHNRFWLAKRPRVLER